MKMSLLLVAFYFFALNCSLAQICDPTCVKASISIKEDSVAFEERHQYNLNIDFYNSCTTQCEIHHPYIGYKSDIPFLVNIYFEMYKLSGSDTILISPTVQDIQYMEAANELLKPAATFNTPCYIFRFYDVETKGIYLYKGYYSPDFEKYPGIQLTQGFTKIVVH